MWLHATSTSMRSNFWMASTLPWLTSQRSSHLEWWRVAGNWWISGYSATRAWMHLIGRRAWATSVSSSNVSSHPLLEVPLCGLWFVETQFTCFDEQVSAWSIRQAFCTIWRSVSALSKYLEIRTFSIIFAKPGLIADTLLIVVLLSFRSLWLFPMSMLSFSSNCWLRSRASQDLVRPLTPRRLMNAPESSCMTCAMWRIWFLNAGHSIPEASSVDCSSRVIE